MRCDSRSGAGSREGLVNSRTDTSWICSGGRVNASLSSSLEGLLLKLLELEKSPSIFSIHKRLFFGLEGSDELEDAETEVDARFSLRMDVMAVKYKRTLVICIASKNACQFPSETPPRKENAPKSAISKVYNGTLCLIVASKKATLEKNEIKRDCVTVFLAPLMLDATSPYTAALTNGQNKEANMRTNYEI